MSNINFYQIIILLYIYIFMSTSQQSVIKQNEKSYKSKAHFFNKIS